MNTLIKHSDKTNAPSSISLSQRNSGNTYGTNEQKPCLWWVLIFIVVFALALIICTIFIEEASVTQHNGNPSPREPKTIESNRGCGCTRGDPIETPGGCGSCQNDSAKKSLTMDLVTYPPPPPPPPPTPAQTDPFPPLPLPFDPPLQRTDGKLNDTFPVYMPGALEGQTPEELAARGIVDYLTPDLIYPGNRPWDPNWKRMKHRVLALKKDLEIRQRRPWRFFFITVTEYWPRIQPGQYFTIPPFPFKSGTSGTQLEDLMNLGMVSAYEATFENRPGTLDHWPLCDIITADLFSCHMSLPGKVKLSDPDVPNPQWALTTLFGSGGIAPTWERNFTDRWEVRLKRDFPRGVVYVVGYPCDPESGYGDEVLMEIEQGLYPINAMSYMIKGIDFMVVFDSYLLPDPQNNEWRSTEWTFYNC